MSYSASSSSYSNAFLASAITISLRSTIFKKKEKKKKKKTDRNTENSMPCSLRIACVGSFTSRRVINIEGL